MAESDTACMWDRVHPWKRYKRHADNVKLEARLVELEGKKFMEARESRGECITCPYCRETLSILSGNEWPNFVLEPKVFHTRHRPLDTD